jgi:L-threonylcarbamoyladenylate synthase
LERSLRCKEHTEGFYDTKILPVNDPAALKTAAELLRNGELVAIPTETVYGLAANALDETAVKHIFSVKGRPQDNPLIVHTFGTDGLRGIVEYVPEIALKLFEAFSPGPLTIVLRKDKNIPSVTSGGLSTVGVRIPQNQYVRTLIKQCGFPLAAPSANLSGKPSPTTAHHVFDDLCGKIPLILDGGVCAVGVESTVIAFDSEDCIRILRPGGITKDQLRKFADVTVDSGVIENVSEQTEVSSPGMKYKHYSPKADITIIDGELEAFARYFNENADEDTFAMMFDDDPDCAIPLKRRINYGSNGREQAAKLFSVLRTFDEKNVKKIFARCPDKSGEGLAVYNRLIRAAGFHIIKL